MRAAVYSIAVIFVLVACGDRGRNETAENQEKDAPAPATPASKPVGPPADDAAPPAASPPTSGIRVAPIRPKPSAFDATQYTPDPVAPETFTVKLTTTKGDVLIDVDREWSPLGADRFHRLVTEGFYDNTALFRVIKGFLVQGGIHGDPEITEAWKERLIPDEPFVESNLYGNVTFASAGKDTRLTQFIIHLKDNEPFDRHGFTPFGKVRNMAVVESLYADYGDGAPRGAGPVPKRIMREGNAYLEADFPELDYIKKATVVPAS